MKIYVAGNCQASVLLELLHGATGLPAEYLARDHDTAFGEPHVIFAQLPCRSWLRDKAIYFPRITMPGFHPDIVLGKENDRTMSPLRGYCSSIVQKAWCESISPQATLELFNRTVFERLGFFEFFDAGKAQLLEEGRAVDFPLDHLFERWLAGGCFMHTVNHPKVRVMADIAELLLAKAGLAWKPIVNPADRQEDGCGWPLYPEIADRLGLEGGYGFRLHSRDGGYVLDLKEFVGRSLEMFAQNNVPRVPSSVRLKSPRYQNLRSALPPAMRGRHPYAGLPEHQYWRKSVRGDVDPVTSSFTIRPKMRIATAGSCFAQHISAALKSNGFNYFVAETDSGQGGSNYGVFSARYGNIYTARQLLQLFDRAFGSFRPCIGAWVRDKRFVDPFRPEIEPDGFETRPALVRARRTHLEAVRHMFKKLDVFIFTLGLTEAWRAKSDGAVFPLAPGVAGGAFNPDFYEFVNFSVAEIVQDLKDFLARLARINSRARVILTVSPVPLIATYEARHVLVSTTYSKSVLRVAAEEVARSCGNVTYFPSYEIVTGNHSRGRYFASDLRSVTPAGVQHVMRMFFRHFAPDAVTAEVVRETLETVCEEERLLKPRLPGTPRAPTIETSPARGIEPAPDSGAGLVRPGVWPAIWQKLNDAFGGRFHGPAPEGRPGIVLAARAPANSDRRRSNARPLS